MSIIPELSWLQVLITGGLAIVTLTTVFLSCKRAELFNAIEHPDGYRLSWVRLLGIPLSGWALGVIARVMRPMTSIDGVHLEAIASLGALLIATMGLCYFHSKRLPRGGAINFQLEQGAMWMGYLSGWTLLHGHFWEDMLGLMGAWGIGCAVVGGILLAIKGRLG